MAADEARGMGIGQWQLFGYKTIFLGVVGEGLQVVTDDFRHTGRRDGDHLRLVERQGVLQPFVHVGVATEYGGIFGHGVGDTGDRLLEMTVEVGTEIGDATLRTMHIGQGLLEAEGTEYGTQGLARLGRIDDQSLALEVQLLVLLAGRPLEDFAHLGVVMGFFKVGPLVGPLCLILILFEQGVAGLDVLYCLAHMLSPPAPLICGLRVNDGC